MIIIPPGLTLNDRKRYFADLKYRNECDQELIAQRYERMQYLFNYCFAKEQD